MQAYRSSTWRSVTLRDRIPPPTGVVSGPLMATRCVRMASRVASGSQFPTCLKAFSPASTSSQSIRSEEHTSELQSQSNLVCRLLLEKKKTCCHDSSLTDTTQWVCWLP